MTDSKKLDDRIHNHEERDGAKLSATADADAARHATKADVDNASNGKNQNGSACLDKKIPKPVDYKSIRLVGLGAVAQLSRDERAAEELKPKAYEEWRGKKAAVMTKEERAAKTDADEAATRLYKSAWKAYLKRTKQKENSIKRVIEETLEILEQE